VIVTVTTNLSPPTRISSVDACPRGITHPSSLARLIPDSPATGVTIAGRRCLFVRIPTWSNCEIAFVFGETRLVTSERSHDDLRLESYRSSDLPWTTAFPITPRKDTEIRPRRVRQHRDELQ